ncbi:hypothetical protein CWE13_02965 [Aliidiomarina shirensis]|uniref:GIY-YIG domain-containing protein n=1 Tax=Aliidiomarina shirensis TaxID=1048642 RepID=A0A432WY14_9GAMM|nr:hypothetical protein [Aliidiomarina shirensis]RUO38621.1 hypothetical protein CWE13_02965 [Aliidiomarina shirensis]
MPKVTFDAIKAAADEFFHRHWPSSEAEVPSWNIPWDLVGTLPGHNKQGIYLLLGEHDEVLYIGVGASLGGGKYTGYGLGRRTNQYFRMAEGQRGVRVKNRQYAPKKKWADRGVSQVVTLGFHQDYAYLAYGLEAFLLREIETPYNKVRSARASNS